MAKVMCAVTANDDITARISINESAIALFGGPPYLTVSRMNQIQSHN